LIVVTALVVCIQPTVTAVFKLKHPVFQYMRIKNSKIHNDQLHAHEPSTETVTNAKKSTTLCKTASLLNNFNMKRYYNHSMTHIQMFIEENNTNATKYQILCSNNTVNESVKLYGIYKKQRMHDIIKLLHITHIK
jgi:hypothetical protein